MKRMSQHDSKRIGEILLNMINLVDKNSEIINEITDELKECSKQIDEQIEKLRNQ